MEYQVDRFLDYPEPHMLLVGLRVHQEVLVSRRLLAGSCHGQAETAVVELEPERQSVTLVSRHVLRIAVTGETQLVQAVKQCLSEVFGFPVAVLELGGLLRDEVDDLGAGDGRAGVAYDDGIPLDVPVVIVGHPDVDLVRMGAEGYHHLAFELDTRLGKVNLERLLGAFLGWPRSVDVFEHFVYV